MTISVIPRHSALGAEIRGVDMRRPMDAETLKAVNDAWMKHLVVVFPDQRITDQEHVAFTRHFGDAEVFHQTSLHLRSDRVREIFLVSNVDDQNRVMPPSEPSQKQLSSSRMWHTDSSYRPVPSTGSLLHGIEISRTGGLTQFINMYMVYDDLPGDLRRQVEGRKARHDFGMLARLVGSPPPTERSGQRCRRSGIRWCGVTPLPAASRSTSARSTTTASKAWTTARRAS